MSKTLIENPSQALSDGGRYTPRVPELDILRGIAIVLVAWDHMWFAFGVLFGQAWVSSGNAFLISLVDFALLYENSALRAYVRPVVLFTFFFVAGVCTALSKNNLIRGLRIGGVALALSWITYLGEVVFKREGLFIVFGVLHCFAACMLIFAGIEKALKRIFPEKHEPARLICLAVLAAAGYIIQILFNSTYSGVADGSFLAGFFIRTRAFEQTTADYFPLIPYIAYFFTGAIAGQIVYREKKSLFPRLNAKKRLPFAFAGRHSLFVYIGVQAIVIYLCVLVSYLVIGVSGF